MVGTKKINLLPIEYKNKVLGRYIIISISAVGGIFAVLIIGILINMFFLNLGINNLKKQNTEYNTTKAEITQLEKQIADNQNFINKQKQKVFDFYSFMSCLESYKPSGLTIVSVDSLDRISIAKEEPNPTASPTPETEKPKVKENTEAPNANNQPKPEESKPIKYEKDLSGDKLVLRGLAKNAQDISTYIYKLSQIPSIVNINLSGIEEQNFNQNEKITVFEAVLEVQ